MSVARRILTGCVFLLFLISPAPAQQGPGQGRQPQDGERNSTRAMLLTTDDLPKGFSLNQAADYSNRDAAAGSAALTGLPLDEWIAAYEGNGRIGGTFITLTRTASNRMDIIISGGEPFRTAEGARDAFAFEHIKLYGSKAAIRNEYKGRGIDVSQIDRLDGLGEFPESVFAKVTGTRESRIPVVALVLAWRDRDVLHTVQWLSFNGTPIEVEFLALARIQHRRSMSRQ
jgi:hypothetical protein